MGLDQLIFSYNPKGALGLSMSSCIPVGFYLACTLGEMGEYAEMLKEMQKITLPKGRGRVIRKILPKQL